MPLAFERLFNALSNDHLADYIERFVVDAEKPPVPDAHIATLQGVEREFGLGPAVCVHNAAAGVDVWVHKVCGSAIGGDAGALVADSTAAVFPVAASCGTVRLKADGRSPCADQATTLVKCKLACAHAPMGVQFGFVIDRHGTWGAFDFAGADAGAVGTVASAAAWVREFEADGGQMIIDPPSRRELFPNMKTRSRIAEVQQVKKQIATANDELTLVRHVGVAERARALDHGVSRWSDARVDAEMLGFNPKTERARLVDTILGANRSTDPPLCVQPRDRCSDGDVFLDLETSSLYEWKDFVFMIGVGWADDQFECLTVSTPSFAEEGRIVRAFVQRLRELGARRLLHWAPHEVNVFKRVEERHSILILRHFDWVDLCKQVQVLRWCPRGAFDFSLKSFARAMRALGMISIGWTSQCADGLEAMQEAHRAFEEHDDATLRDIESYNRVDVVATMQIWRHLDAVGLCV